MPRVLFLDQTSQLGGAELSLLSLVRARGLAARDRIVLFEGGRFQQILAEEGYDVVVSPLGEGVGDVKKDSGLARQLGAVRGTQRQVQEIRKLARGCDVVYANTAKALVIGALAFRHRPEPLVYHLRDIVTASHFSRANRWALVTLANCYAARVIANSQATADAFVAAGGRRALVTVIPNGFDPVPFDRAIEERKRVGGGQDGVGGGRWAVGSEEMASGPQPTAHSPQPLAHSPRPVVAVFGRLAPWKGQDVAIRAIARLAEAELWIVGDALFGEQAYAEELEALAVELGVADRVSFLGFRDDVLELMQQADVVAHTSIAPEPLGRVVIEGLLSARPVVASRGGGVQEIVDEGETGLLYPMGDADALAGCIQQLLDDPVYAERLATAGAEVARRRYAIDRVAAETSAVIEAVAAAAAA